MHQNRSAPDPAGGAYSAPPDPLAVTEEGRGRGGGGEGEREREGEGRGERRGGEGRRGEGTLQFSPQPRLLGYATAHRNHRSSSERGRTYNNMIH